MSDDYMAFIRLFRAVTAGMQVKQIAETMGVTIPCVYGWLNCRTAMNGESVIRAIWVFGIDMRALYDAKWGALS